MDHELVLRAQRGDVDAFSSLTSGRTARLYALAADRLRGPRRLGGLLYTFVRYGITVPLRVEAAMLEDWSTWLARLPEADRREAAR